MRSVLLCVAVFAASAAAQTAVLPLSAQGVAGNSYGTLPWGYSGAGYAGIRTMCLYDSSHFTSAPTPINQPIVITHVRWRANDVASTSSWTGGTYTNASLALATAAVDYTFASPDWATNCRPDYATVYHGPVTVIGGAGAGVGVVGPIVVDITLTTPFYYDPNAGDLVVDTDWVTGAWGGGTFAPLDAMINTSLALRVLSATQYPTADGIDSGAPVVEIGFVPAGPGTPVATNTLRGSGCGAAPDASTYEFFPSLAAFDLANTSISMIHTGAGYLAMPGVTSYVPPSAAAQVLPLLNDNEFRVNLPQPMPTSVGSTTSQLVVCSNGFISAGLGNGWSSTPSPAVFLAGPRIWWSLCWHDFYPSLSGGWVKFEQIGTIAYITWDGVRDNSVSSVGTSTMQAQFEITTGTVHFVYGAMSAGGNARLVGISDAGASTDPGSMDISAALPSTYTALRFALDPLALAGPSRPVLGTNWNLAVAHVPPTGTVGIEVFGVTDPGIDDLSFLGMPNCGLRASLDVLQAWIVTGAAHPYGIAVPNNPALVSSRVFTTAVVLSPGANPFGVLTSNGIDGRIGSF